MKIQLIRKPIYQSTFNGKVKEYQNYYLIKQGKEYFFRNLSINDILEVKGFKLLLQEFKSNEYKFLCDSSIRFFHPFQLLNWCDANKVLIVINNPLSYEASNLGFHFFDGLIEGVEAFRFRIYDDDLMLEIEEQLKTLKAKFL